MTPTTGAPHDDRTSRDGTPLPARMRPGTVVALGLVAFVLGMLIFVLAGGLEDQGEDGRAAGSSTVGVVVAVVPDGGS